ncbi:MAG TPA: O-antigen ligase family protein [bacterium]|nr:O-antigen ligase family protein [bacterium]HPO11244.1 O-antigen ligase family protein [bacterium]
MFLNFCIFIFIIIFTLFSIKKERASIFLIILLFPTYLVRFKFFEIPTTLLEIMLISLFISFAYQIIKNRIDIKFYNFFFVLFGLFIVSCISLKISDNSFQSLGIFKSYIIEPMLFFIILINRLKTKQDLNLIIDVLGLSTIYLSIYAIFQKITGVGISQSDPLWTAKATRRVTSVFEYPNALGLYIAPIVSLYIGKFIAFIKNKKLRKNKFLLIFNLAVIILGILSIIFAKSEGALVAVIASIIFILFLYTKDKLNFVFAFIILITILFFIPSTQKILNNKILLNDYSGKIRYQMWVETKNMLKDNFLFGAGLNNYQNKIQPYKLNKNYETFLFPHNIFLNFWSELGFFGLIIFLIIFYIFFKKCYLLKDKNKTLSIAISASMFALIIHGLVDVPFFKNDLSLLFWTIISLIILLERIDDNEIEVIKMN